MRREDFIPDVIWVRRDDGWRVPLNRADDPDTWLALVNGGDAIVTQMDDGTDHYDGKGITPTSSSTAPWLMDKMLGLLDLQKGLSVLEIGTGTGYNAALIGEKVAPGRVITIEIAPTVAEHARARLARTDLPVTVITGDGTLGYPEGSPYDRTVVTADVFDVPYSWVQQTRPGGLIVLPLAGSFQYGTLARLAVADDGTASGRFHGEAAFMYLRDQRPDKTLSRIGNQDGAQFTWTSDYPHEPFVDFNAGFAVSTRLFGWVTSTREEDDGAILRMSHRASGSWATVSPSDTGSHAVAYEGPRRLWEELEAAYRWWIDAGRPDHTRFGLTVTPTGQTFWLDSPDNLLPPIGEETTG
ncbi:MAG: methyltransferase domain-containing protein [Frankia sp.]|nr:methyltransferase domain-containing protein [Frankia sp.]